MFCVSCSTPFPKKTTIRQIQKFFCSKCVRNKKLDVIYNHYTGEKCDAQLCFKEPVTPEVKRYTARVAGLDVLLSF